MVGGRSRIRGLVRPALLVLAVVAAYVPGLGAPFVFDDVYAIADNESIRDLSRPMAVLSPPRDTPVAGRPVVNATLAVNYALGGLDPFGYRLFNLIVHACSALLLFGIVRRTLSGSVMGLRFAPAAGSLALATALVWALHPALTEAVTYVTQRTESMMGLALLATVYCVIRGQYSPRPVAWDVAAVSCCALGMGCKESMVVAPLLVLLYDHAYGSVALRKRRPLYAGLAATWLLLAILMLGGPRSGTVGFGLGVDPPEYALNQAEAVLHYLRVAVLPTGLVIDHGPPRVPPHPTSLIAAGVVVALVAVSVGLYRRRPAAGYPIAWFLLTLAPTTSFVPIVTEVSADRRLYVPLMGLVALSVVGVSRLLQPTDGRDPLPLRRRATPVTAVLAITLAVGTMRRNLQYHDPVALWQQAVTARPDNPRALANLGAALAAAGWPEAAVPWLTEAARLAPESRLIRANLDIVRAAATP